MDPTLKMNEKIEEIVEQTISVETNSIALSCSENDEIVEKMDEDVVNDLSTTMSKKRHNSSDFISKSNKKFKSDNHLPPNGLDFESKYVDITATDQDILNVYNDFTKLFQFYSEDLKIFSLECYFIDEREYPFDKNIQKYSDKIKAFFKNCFDTDLSKYGNLLEASLHDDPANSNLLWPVKKTIPKEIDPPTKNEDDKSETVIPKTEPSTEDNQVDNLNAEVSEKSNDANCVLTAEEQAQLVISARQEADVRKRVNELRKKGMWSLKRLPKVKEPERYKTHWDYLLEEMQWLAVDFASERKWKIASAKRCARAGIRFTMLKESEVEKKAKEHIVKIKKRANAIAKLSKNFWSDMGKVFDKKQELLLEEKRKKMQNIQLKYIVDKADHLTEKLAHELIPHKNSIESSTCSDRDSSICPADEDFEQGSICSDDDEETLDIEENQCQQVSAKDEINDLVKDSEIPIEQLLLKEYNIDLEEKFELMETDENASGYNDELEEETDIEADDEEDSNLDDDISSNDEENVNSLIDNSMVNLILLFVFI